MKHLHFGSRPYIISSCHSCCSCEFCKRKLYIAAHHVFHFQPRGQEKKKKKEEVHSKGQTAARLVGYFIPTQTQTLSTVCETHGACL